MSKYINSMIRIGDSGKSATDVNAINIHGSSHRVGINTNPTGYMFDVSGSLNCSTLSINNEPVALGGHWTKSGTTVSYSSGNVGIGISTPAYLLDVNGTINTTKLQLKNSNISSTTNDQIIMNVGRGNVYFEKNNNSTIDGTVKPGLTLRVSDNPTNGSLFDVRSSGNGCRLFVGQSITTPGTNPFYFGYTSGTADVYDTSKYNGILDSSGITLYNGAVFTGDLVGNATTSTTATTSGSCTGNAATATRLQTARTIGGVSFNGTTNISLPGVNIAGNQDTTGNAATVTNGVYTTGNQTIGGVKTFSSNIIVANNTNSTSVLGNVKIGYCGHNDAASISHFDHNTTTNYGFLQSGDGTTYVNAPTGKSLRFRLNNSDIAFIQSDGLNTDSWIRIGGNVGVYFKTHGGGWYMSDTNWIRVHGNKGILTTGTIQCTNFTSTSDCTFNGLVNANQFSGDGSNLTNVTATTATNINVVSNNATNSNHYIIFTGGATGDQIPNSDAGLYYNPSSDILTAGTFNGSLNGNAATATTAGSCTGNAVTATTATNATNATNFNVAADNGTNSNHYLIFTGGATGNQRPNSDTALYYNPSSNLLTAGSFNATSDLTLKTNISELSMPLEKILNIEGKNYTWKKDENNVVQSGLIAQQVEEYIPEVIVTNKENNIKTINYNGIIPYLVEGMKEQQRQIESQKSEIEELKNMVKRLVEVTSLLN